MNYRIGIVEWAFPVPGPYGLKIAADMGIEGMELDFGDYETGFKLSNPVIQKAYMECGSQFGVEFPSIALNALNAHGMRHGRNTYDGMIAVETICRGVQAAADMKIPVVQVPSFDDGAIDSEEDFWNTCEKVRLACELAKRHDIIIAVENVLSAEDSLKMIREVNCDNLKVFYDSQNYQLEKGYSQQEILRELKEYICQIHIKDGFNQTISSALLGKGDTEFYKTVQIIKECHCTTWLLLENYYNQKPLSLLNADAFTLLAEDIRTVQQAFA